MSDTQIDSIKNLSEDEKQKAFEETLKHFEPVPGIKLVRITEEYYEKAINLCRDHFIPHEPMMKSVGASFCEVIEAYWLETLQLNLSLMFVNEETGEAIAFRTIRYALKDEKLEFDVDQLPEDLKILLHFSEFLDKKAAFFDHYGITEAFQFLALVVAPKYQRRGLATKIFHAAIDFVTNFGFSQVHIKGEGSSNFSKRIYEKEGYTVLYEHVYEDWVVDGRRPFLNTGEHKSIKIYGKKIENE